jgi:hypothetical protein
MKSLIILAAASLLATAAFAKLPPLTEEAKAKAAEAAAKTAWSGKVEAWQLCKSQDRVAAFYYKTSKAEGVDSGRARAHRLRRQARDRHADDAGRAPRAAGAGLPAQPAAGGVGR